MKGVRWFVGGAGVTVLSDGAPPRTQRALNAKAIELNGGKYSSDCSDQAARRSLRQQRLSAVWSPVGASRTTCKRVSENSAYVESRGDSPLN